MHGECCYEGNESLFCKVFQSASKAKQDAIRYYFNDDCSELENEFMQELANAKDLSVIPITKEAALGY